MINYDTFAEQYAEMVKRGGPGKVHRYIVELLQHETVLTGKSICDLGCGQGELAAALSGLGAAHVTGVDFSQAMLSNAQKLSDQVNWVRDDAMTLSSIPDATFDIVTSSVMLMDVSDHLAVFRQSCRILKAGGLMVWVVMHPCFQSPYCVLHEDGSRSVSEYAAQYWKSKGTGTLRSVLGAYHRPLSHYVNDFMKAGFTLDRTFEPGFEAPLSLAEPSPSPQGMPQHFGALGWKKG